jgi:hypothetical protein
MWAENPALGVDKGPSGPDATYGQTMDPDGMAVATTISSLAPAASQGGVVDPSNLHSIQKLTGNSSNAK